MTNIHSCLNCVVAFSIFAHSTGIIIKMVHCISHRIQNNVAIAGNLRCQIIA